jgi:peptidyl-dipeptidase Dcp
MRTQTAQPGRGLVRLALCLAMLSGSAMTLADTLPTSQETNPPTMTTANPFFAPSKLPFEAPDFRLIKDEHYLPALTEGMRLHLAEVEAIAANPEAPTVANTLEALERAGSVLARVSNVFFNLTGTDSTASLREIEAQIAPLLAAHQDAILFNPRLFARVKALYDAKEKHGSDPQTRRLIEQTHLRFVRAGAKLSEETKAQIRTLNEEQAALMTAFRQTILKQAKLAAVVVDDVAQLDGMSEGEIAAAAEAATAEGHAGKWLLRITNTTRQPVLTSLKNRELRQRVWEASAMRGLTEGEGDTRAMVLRLASLRAELASLLGKPNWASHQLEDQMSGGPEPVYKMLRNMVPTVVVNAKREAADIQALIKSEGKSYLVEPWDWEFYAERVRAERYDLDPEEVKPYFEFNRVLRDGVFYALNRFYGVSFRERTDLPVYHPSVLVFDVLDHDGTQIGLFYADYFARPSKRGGAWMSTFVDQSGLLGHKPVVINVMNIAPPAQGQPALMTFDEVVTMFHEVGHGVHGLFSDVRYPSLAGTNVPRDYVEFPSQFEEDWAKHPEVLASYAKHHETGAPIPEELLAKILRASGFNQGFDTLEYIAAALLDLEWHTLPVGTVVEDVEAFEKRALSKNGVNYWPVPPRYRSTYFAHVFPGGYSAAYYAYIWSEVLAADAFAYVSERGGLTRELGDEYRKAILSRGGSVEPMQMYKDWRGQEPDTKHLLYRRGLLKRTEK